MEFVFFLLTFFFVYFLYFLFVIMRKKSLKKIEHSAEAMLLKKYKVDINKIQSKHFLHVIGFTNSFIISLTLSIVSFFDSFMIQMVVGFFVFIPLIFLMYYVVSLFYRKKGFYESDAN